MAPTGIGDAVRRFNRRILLRTRFGNLTGRLLFDVVLILAGSLCMALSVDIFLNPNNVVPGGFTALAMFANRLWGWPVGTTLFIMNLPFLLIGIGFACLVVNIPGSDLALEGGLFNYAYKGVSLLIVPPSEKESGVALITPMTRVRLASSITRRGVFS